MSAFTKGVTYQFHTERDSCAVFYDDNWEEHHIYDMAYSGDIYIKDSKGYHKRISRFVSFKANAKYTCISVSPLVFEGPVYLSFVSTWTKPYEAPLSDALARWFPAANIPFLSRYFFRVCSFDFRSDKVRDIDEFIKGFLIDHLSSYAGSRNGKHDWEVEVRDFFLYAYPDDPLLRDALCEAICVGYIYIPNTDVKPDTEQHVIYIRNMEIHEFANSLLAPVRLDIAE